MTISTTSPSQTSDDELFIDLGGHELKVILNPNISAELKKVIKDNIEVSMSSDSGDSNQYEPTVLAELVNGNEAIASTLSERDLEMVEALNSHYDYIEI